MNQLGDWRCLYITKFSPLQSSRFRYINLLEDVVLGFEIKIITRELTIPQLPTDREKRLEFIYQLHLEGRSNKFITDYFNSRDVKTPRGKSYTQKNIWVTIEKYKKRLERMTDTTYTTTDWIAYEILK